MKSPSSSRLSPLSSLACTLIPSACMMSALLFVGAATPAFSAPLPLPTVSASVFSVIGAATNTVTSLTFITDTTISIESDQVGHLSHFGNFTGHFSYLAEASPATINLVGSATLTNDHGEQLFVTATILEVGSDYPRPLDGVVTVTGGTGRFANAKGLINISGVDQADLTDTVTLRGLLVAPGVR